MKTIEFLLTHSNQLVRCLIKGLMELGYQNIEVNVEMSNFHKVYGSFVINKIRFAILGPANFNQGFCYFKNQVWKCAIDFKEVIELLKVVSKDET